MSWEDLAQQHESSARTLLRVGELRLAWWQWVFAADAWFRASEETTGIERDRLAVEHSKAVREQSALGDRLADALDESVRRLRPSSFGGDA